MSSEFSVSIADADRYAISIAGYQISFGAGQSGYADGEFFTIEQEGNSFEIVEGSDGSVARSKSFGQILIMSVSLLQTSISNDVLSALFASDNNHPSGRGIGSMSLDGFGKAIIRCTNSWIQKPTDILLGPGATVRKWPICGVYSLYALGDTLSP